MPQNWWEEFPEVLPSPAARPRPLPGPGAIMPAAAMAARAPSPFDMLGADPAPLGPFVSAPLPGGQPRMGDQPGTDPAPPLAGDDDGSAMDRRAAILHAADAVQRGADPDAVHARLIEMGQGDGNSQIQFEDLIPDGRQELEASPPRAAPSLEQQATFPGNRPHAGSVYPATNTSNVRESAPQISKMSGEPKASQPMPASHFRGMLSPRIAGETRGSSSTDDMNGYGYAPSTGDLNLLARALFAEFSTADNWPDMAAGAWSILNRIRPNGLWPRYRTRDTIGTSLPEVLSKRLQYSFMSPGGIGAPGGSRQWQRSAHPETLDGPDRQAWALAMRVAQGVLNGNIPDPTGGATHFFNRSVNPEYFRRATTGPNPRLRPSPYRSPTGQNFFFQDLEDRPRAAQFHPGPLRLRVQPPLLNVSGQGSAKSNFP